MKKINLILLALLVLSTTLTSSSLPVQAQTLTDSSNQIVSGSPVLAVTKTWVKIGINPTYGWEEFSDKFGNAAVFVCGTGDSELPYLQSYMFDGKIRFQNAAICVDTQDRVRAHLKNDPRNTVAVTFQGPTILNIQLK